MKLKLLFLPILLLAVLCSPAYSAPMPPVGPVSIEGTIRSIEWSPARVAKGIPGMSGSAGHDRTFPARYRITLKDVRVTGVNTASFQGKETVAIELPHQADDGYLRTGMRIRVTDYSERGDEGGTWTRFGDIRILGEPPPSGKIPQ